MSKSKAKARKFRPGDVLAAGEIEPGVPIVVEVKHVVSPIPEAVTVLTGSRVIEVREFPRVPACPECGRKHTRHRSTQGEVQYRQCEMPSCRVTFKVVKVTY